MFSKHAVKRRGSIHKRLIMLSLLVIVVSVWVGTASPSMPTYADYTPGIPEAVDPGTPPFSGSEEPVPPEPVVA